MGLDLPSKAMTALDAKLDLIRYWDTDRDDVILTPHDLNAWRGRPTDAWSADDGFAFRPADRLRNASTFWVSSDMTRLALSQVGKVPEQGLSRDEVIVPSGFIYLETPIQGPPLMTERAIGLSQKSTPLLIQAVEWTLIWMRDDAFDEDGVATSSTECNEVEGEWWEIDISLYGPVDGKLTYLSHGRWMEGEDSAMFPVEDEDGEHTNNIFFMVHDRNGFSDWLLAFWLLTRERLVRVSRQVLPRAASRRAQRLLFDVPEVKVVTLRATDWIRSQDPQGEVVNWSHRWVVNAHWHRYWCGSGADRHLERKFIGPYVKGPADAPLLLKETLYKVSR